MKRLSFPVQIVIGLAAGLIVGLCSKTLGIYMQDVGDAFTRLIEMAIIPLIFPLIVLGVAQMRSLRRLGRIAGKAILYFEVVTTVILLVAVIIGNVIPVGADFPLPHTSTAALHGFAQGIDFQQFLLNIIPDNVFASFVNGDLLPIVFFSLFLGLAMAAAGETVQPLYDVLSALSTAMFKVIEYVVRFTPIGVFGFIAYDVAEYGWGSLRSMAEFVLIAYVGMLVVMLVILPVTARLFGVRYWTLIRYIWDLIALAFVTRSSEVVLAPLTKRLEQFGAHNSIVSFVLPVGYSFNLDGATVYEAIAVLFLSHVYHLHLSLGQQFETIGLLMILTKGLAGVPGAAIVVLIATAKAIGLPLEGISLLVGVDFIVDMARTAVNVVGNSLASVVIAKSERLFQPQEETPRPLPVEAQGRV
ncbi:dicarboxylate/amino acid:cation symporter [Alicyclobacillus kakegawensis]|uniref:dicarboxylate/amino acid:cation symporter n=1 Tax=Alicyclobacillus kakegawensis TaxID=392012 RepID=UPI000AD9283B|nr:dicarboxylate/amino acid:cation symporter [Alicyclobacillus kakegawensis]